MRRVILLLPLLLAVSFMGSARAAEASSVYKLGASDVIDIKVVGQAELETQARVDGQGNILVPYLSVLSVGGLTTDQAADKVSRMLQAKGVVKNPQVTVFITTYGQFVSVLGAVALPGVFPLDHQVRLSDLLARAGGLKPGSGAFLTLRHSDGGAAIRIAMKPLLEGTDPTQDLILLNGDSVYVPDAPIYYLDGSVNHPGSYPMRDPLTVRQALAQGGGILPIGSERGLQVVRSAADGSIAKVDVELDDIVQPNDTIVVSEKLF